VMVPAQKILETAIAESLTDPDYVRSSPGDAPVLAFMDALSAARANGCHEPEPGVIAQDDAYRFGDRLASVTFALEAEVAGVFRW